MKNIILSLSIILLFASTNLFAQQTPKKEDEYKLLKSKTISAPGDFQTIYEKKVYVPDAKIYGSYEFLYGGRKGSFFNKDDDNSYSFMKQEITLGFRSEVNTNVSLNVELSNKYYLLNDNQKNFNKKSQYIKDNSELDNAQSSNDLDVVMSKAFLEYNHNPSAILRLGKQEINVGDRRGMVFRGNLTGLTQSCKIGTWCYYIGWAKLGAYSGDSLYWAQLDYPVFESGKMIADPWGKLETRNEKSLNVEIFRIFQNQSDIPLAAYGGQTWRSSSYNASDPDSYSQYQEKNNGKLAYYDVKGQYIGTNINWVNKDFELDFSYVQNFGDRKYHTGTQSDGDVADITDLDSDEQEKSFYAKAYFLNMEYRYHELWKAGFEHVSSSGHKSENANEKVWARSSTGFFEINKGTFGDAQIYFSGYDGSGEGHSISNVTYYAANLSYMSAKRDLGFDTKIFKFLRTEAVWNEDGEKVSDIGTELDAKLTVKLEPTLSFIVKGSMFLTGNAYSINDSQKPKTGDNKQKTFTAYSFGLNYKF